MALVVATLATLIISGLFWNQFVVLRTIENQQLVSQSRLLLRGALDWARAILREDAVRSSYDALAEPWAQPLAETRLDQLGETSALASRATIAGSIEDAQSRFNLRNLVQKDGQIVKREVEALRRLVSVLGLPEQTADLIALRMAQAYAPATTDAGAATADDGQGKPIPLVLAQDLTAVAGIDPAAAAKLAPYVVVLDEPTPVNLNTAEPEVFVARLPKLSLADARSIAEQRNRVPFLNRGDIRNRLGERGDGMADADIAVGSQYFFVRGRVKLDRADTRMEALVKRSQPRTAGPVAILWQREL
jgi:general secretion pathway protein K